KAPMSRRREKFGSNPSFIHFSVSSGSCPSKPTMTTRVARLAPARFGRKMRLSTQRKGQVRRKKKAEASAGKRTKKNETMGKPAPGPRYACAMCGQRRSAPKIKGRPLRCALDMASSGLPIPVKTSLDCASHRGKVELAPEEVTDAMGFTTRVFDHRRIVQVKH